MHKVREMLFWACVAATTPSLWTVARAEDSGGANGEADAVRAAANEYLAAVRRGETEALLRMWTENGDYVDATGKIVKAHELIRKRAAAPSSSPSTHESSGPREFTAIRHANRGH